MQEEGIGNVMPEVRINNNDLLIMNLVHYFITEKNYNPVVLHGITDEIWLENLDSDYKIIRIVSRYIHNNEQLRFDKFKLKRILDNLKKKTFSFNMPVVSIYTSLGDGVELEKENADNELNFFISKISEIKNPTLIEIFPDIVEKTNHKEKGIDLFVKISDDINKESFEKSKRVEKIFAPKIPIITYAIIFVCIFMFIISLFMGESNFLFIDRNVLYLLGANNNVAVNGGELYRLFTCIFLHAGIIHLLCNMYSLYVIGPQVESFYGKLKYIFIFFFSGICGSILSLAFSGNNLISVGASGAIFGLLGSILYFGYHYRVYLGNALKSQIVPVIILNLMIGFMITGIDNFAHIGGLIGGVFASMAVGVPDKSGTSDKASGCILMLIYLGFIIYLAFFK